MMDTLRPPNVPIYVVVTKPGSESETLFMVPESDGSCNLDEILSHLDGSMTENIAALDLEWVTTTVNHIAVLSFCVMIKDKPTVLIFHVPDTIKSSSKLADRLVRLIASLHKVYILGHHDLKPLQDSEHPYILSILVPKIVPIRKNPGVGLKTWFPALSKQLLSSAEGFSDRRYIPTSCI